MRLPVLALHLENAQRSFNNRIVQPSTDRPDVHGIAVIYLGGVSVTQPIIDGGGLSAERDAAGEVERALRMRAGIQKQFEQRALALQEARRAFELLEIEYQAGAGEMLAVLDAQRTLFRTEDELSQLHLAKCARVSRS